MIFFVHSKFEVKKFLEFFTLPSTLNLVCQGRGVWAPTFFGHAKFEVKNFLELFNLQSAVDAEFFAGGSLYQPFLVTPNLRSKIWHQAPTFFGHTKFEVKYFLEFLNLQRAMDS